MNDRAVVPVMHRKSPPKTERPPAVVVENTADGLREKQTGEKKKEK